MQRLTGTTEAKLQLAHVGRLTPDSGKRNCCHHWVIDVAVGPLSKGECRLCGAERLFRNHLRWAEIAPVRVAVTPRRVNDSVPISEEGAEGRRRFGSGERERIEEVFGYAIADRR